MVKDATTCDRLRVAAWALAAVEELLAHDGVRCALVVSGTAARWRTNGSGSAAASIHCPSAGS